MLLIDAIGILVTMDDNRGGLGLIADAAMVIKDENIFWYGKKTELPAFDIHKKIDANGNMVMPGLIDCHSHLLFSGSRVDDFSRRMNNEDYHSIMKKGGGVMSTVEATREASDEELLHRARRFLNKILLQGVTTLEAKSGYGLSVEDELRTLRLIKKLDETHALDIHPSFLGAHVVPQEYQTKRQKYVALIIDEMLPQIVKEKLALDCDVFCDKGAFSVEESFAILSRANKLGLGLRAHVQQLGQTGGVSLVKKLPIKSISHGEFLSEDDIVTLKNSGCVVEILPFASLFLRSPCPKVCELRKADIPLAIATDFNPGSAMCHDLVLAARLAVTYGHFSIEDALMAITKNAAKSLGLNDRGVVKIGALADLLITNCQNVAELFYDWTKQPVLFTIKRGKNIFTAQQ